MGKEIETRVRQRSIQRPLLFNISLHDIFYFINNDNLLNHSNDNKLCSIEKKTKTWSRKILKCQSGLRNTILF